MAQATQTEEQLASLASIANSPNSAEARKLLRKHLSSKVAPVAAKAASIIAHIDQSEFIPDLTAAFHRFMQNPVKSDKGCVAKIAIIKALLAGECDDEKTFLKGIRHVQMEPTWGGRADTAAPLRALCGLGLVQMGSADVLNELAALLADPEGDARIGAAHALANCGATAAPLLRFKVLTGDSEPAVLAECLTGLMALSPRASLDFVAGFVDQKHPSLYEPAALALAESRLPEVFDLLKERWTATFDREFKQTLLLPIALTRAEGAPDFLIWVLESGEPAMGTAAIQALRIYRDDGSIRKRAQQVIDGPHSEQLLAVLRREFD